MKTEQTIFAEGIPHPHAQLPVQIDSLHSLRYGFLILPKIFRVNQIAHNGIVILRQLIHRIDHGINVAFILLPKPLLSHMYPAFL